MSTDKLIDQLLNKLDQINLPTDVNYLLKRIRHSQSKEREKVTKQAYNIAKCWINKFEEQDKS